MEPGIIPFREFIPYRRDSVTATNLNAVVRGLEATRRKVNNPNPPRIGDGKVAEVRIGVIIATGPNNEADLTGNEYWVRYQRPVYDDEEGRVIIDDETKPGIAAVIRAMNISENFDSHDQRTNGTAYVQIYKVVYPACPSIALWYFTGLALPTGQYKYQSYQTVAQRTGGFDFQRAHPPVI
jgi:hypothetical protein